MTDMDDLGARALLVPARSLDDYLARGGGDALLAASVIGADATIRELDHAGLRDRGGEGFPTGRRWRAVRDAGPVGAVAAIVAPRHLAATKHTALLDANPHAVIEGALVAASTLGARIVALAIDQRDVALVDSVDTAIAMWHDAGITAGCRLHTIDRAGVEGDAVEHNVLVDDVETFAHVTTVLAGGVERFRTRGTVRAPGTMLFALDGDVRRPGVYELPLGTPLRVLVERVGGGTASQLAVKCIVPDDHAPVLAAGDLDVGLDFDAFAEAGSDLGAGAFTVYATDVCAVSLARAYADAAHAVACPDCSPCTRAIAGALADVERAATLEQLGVLHDALLAASDGTCCGVPLGVQRRVASLLRHFPADLDVHLAAGGARCELRHDVDASGGPVAPVVAIAPTGDPSEPVTVGRAPGVPGPAGAGRRRWALTWQT